MNQLKEEILDAEANYQANHSTIFSYLCKSSQKLVTFAMTNVHNLRDQLIEGLLDGDTIEALLQEKDLTLDKAISKCRVQEAIVPTSPMTTQKQLLPYTRNVTAHQQRAQVVVPDHIQVVVRNVQRMAFPATTV